MIPLGDVSRRPFHFPVATLLLILLNGFAFWLELTQGNVFLSRWALIPAHVSSGRAWITVLTAMFLHAGWLHILSNMLFFWVFGPQIEDIMGPLSFIVFYLLGGIAATIAQIYVSPYSLIPNIGASGAIAAVMGAFLINFPRDRIRTLIFLGIFINIAFIPAILLVGLWFLLQVFNGFGSLASADVGGVAYMAHIGGFIFGILFSRIFESSRRRRLQGLEE
jgi:membrane associated rhomboid family serine protease